MRSGDARTPHGHRAASAVARGIAAFAVAAATCSAPVFADPMHELSEFCIGEGGNPPCGYVGSSGGVVIGPRYEAVGRFAKNGLAVVRDGSGYAVIDARGAWIVSPGTFAEILDYAGDGLAPARLDAGEEPYGGIGGITAPVSRWGFIDGRGRWAVPPVFLEVHPFARNGLALARAPGRGRFGYIDRRGQWVIRPRYVFAQGFGANGLAPVRAGDSPQTPDLGGGKVGYIDRSGRWIIEPTFQHAYPFSANGLAAAIDTASRKVGYIDRTGSWRIAPTFQHAGAFSLPDRAVVTMDGGRSAIIDARGAAVPSGAFRRVDDIGSDGLARASGMHAGVEGWGVVDADGRWVVPPVFERLGSARHPAQVVAPNGLAWGMHAGRPRVVDRQGRFLPAFDDYVARYRPPPSPAVPPVRTHAPGGLSPANVAVHGFVGMLFLAVMAAWPLLLVAGLVLVGVLIAARVGRKPRIASGAR